MWATYFDLSPFNCTHWTIPVKVVKDLSDAPFDGHLGNYRDWHDQIRDHLLGANQGYGRILYEVERASQPITMAQLHRDPTPL